ncbi:hypothetical protein Bca4012_039045 [Brassica carinata]|uniref:Uncharacterized protein n=1 Tax=Brassica carinata TaxID=52824 RepID=A0A8X8B6U7_BRACI|nr:hypothetical protein Bca52824_007263 [Brassica carinata]
MGASQLVMVFTFLLFAMAIENTIYVVTALTGIGMGFQLLSIATISELFGLRHSGINFNVILLANPVTFLVLAGVCGLGTLLTIILTVRIRPVYQALHASGSFMWSLISPGKVRETKDDIKDIK